jgi:phosphoglycolate phosphatase
VKYRLVSFDFDGTLADSAEWFGPVLDQLADEFHFQRLRKEDREKVRRYDTREILRHLKVPMWKMPAIALRMRALAARDRDKIGLFPGIANLLRDLKSHGLATAVVSSNAEATIRHILNRQNADYLDYYVCGASLFGKAIKLRKLLRTTGVSAARAIYVGDETRDAIAAKEAGLDFGAVTWGYAAAEALIAHSPRLVFTKVDEILGKLRACP